ncbi:MAG: hypothetical protein HY902_07370 [Deltaproteobacteria bacterium]|nr:hypothetical protein [Deltaproteobacteria bacterium]
MSDLQPSSPQDPESAYGELPPQGCAFTPLRILGLAFIGLPIWNGVLWAVAGDLGIGLQGEVGLQLFELFSVSTFLATVFGVRLWVRRRRRDVAPTSAD